MFKSEIKTEGLKEVEDLLKGVNDRFIDPSYELKNTSNYI